MTPDETRALPSGAEVYLRVTLLGESNERGWFHVKPTKRAGTTVRIIPAADIECAAPVRPLEVGDRVMREGHTLPRTILFIYGNFATTRADILNKLSLEPLSELARA